MARKEEKKLRRRKPLQQRMKMKMMKWTLSSERTQTAKAFLILAMFGVLKVMKLF